jgi:hypothetical protein
MPGERTGVCLAADLAAAVRSAGTLLRRATGILPEAGPLGARIGSRESVVAQGEP